MSVRERALATASRRAAAGAGPLRASLSGWRRQLPRRRARGAVIAISGLDGAGKSSQAQDLATALRKLGVEATVSWSRFAWDDALARFSVPLKRAIAVPAALVLSLRLGGPGAGQAPDGRSGAAGVSGDVADPVRTLRERSSLLTQAWTCVVAAFNVVDHNRLVLPRLRRGEVVICDRYMLDSVVALRFDYGPTRRFRPQRWLIANLSPKPLCAFFLDVSPATARERKPEHSVEWLTGHATLYRQEFQSLGVVRLDGERPRAELCTEIGMHVWSRLR